MFTVYRLAKFLFAMPHEDGLYHANSEEQCDEGTAAIADEGEGEAGNRQETDVHTNTDEGLEKENGRYPGTDVFSGRIRAEGGGAQDAHEDEAHQAEDDQGAKNESHFLSNHGEDEVSVLHAQEAELALGALHVTFAP